MTEYEYERDALLAKLDLCIYEAEHGQRQCSNHTLRLLKEAYRAIEAEVVPAPTPIEDDAHRGSEEA